MTGRFIRQCDTFIEKNPEELIGKQTVVSKCSAQVSGVHRKDEFKTLCVSEMFADLID